MTTCSELESIGTKVQKLSRGSFFKRMWFSRANTNRLKDLGAAMEQAKNNFTVYYYHIHSPSNTSLTDNIDAKLT